MPGAGHMESTGRAARALAFHKIGLARTLLAAGLDVLMADADAIFMRDPTGYFAGCAPWASVVCRAGRLAGQLAPHAQAQAHARHMHMQSLLVHEAVHGNIQPAKPAEWAARSPGGLQ